MKALTVLSVIGILASFGGFEQGMFELGGLLIRIAIFAAIAYLTAVMDVNRTKKHHPVK